MTQLADDCFAFGGNLMTAAEALGLLAERVVPVAGTERLPLASAVGRILAEDVVSTVTVPPRDNAAVDGYAFAFDSLAPAGPSRLPVAGRAAAGRPLEGVTAAAGAVRIFTGAALPDGCDTVVMQEDVTLDGDRVVVPPGLRRGANRRRAGEDVQSGDTVLARGCRLRPQEIGLAAAIGRPALTVYRRLKVALFSTGDELRDPDATLSAGAIHDSNRFLLAGLLHRQGVAVSDLGILPDRPERVRAALAQAAPDHDLLLTSGGVSTGEEDHVRAAVEALGRLHFWRLAIKPGRPLAMGQVAGTPFVGLPGNPVAAMVCFIRFCRPLILGLAGAAQVEPAVYQVRAGFAHGKKPGRREWLRARLQRAADGSLTAMPFPRQGSGILTSLVQSDGLVELPEQVTRVEPGTMVDFLPYQEVCG